MNPSPPSSQTYCQDIFQYYRRKSRVVKVRNVCIGGEHSPQIQSMITSDTRNTADCVAEIISLAKAGCKLVRVTAQTINYAKNLENIVREVRQANCDVAIVADIHFKPDAAIEAAKWVDKVRINPGNYADSKKFKVIEYDDVSYAAELERIREKFAPLVTICKERAIALRIGTNHGSLSDRIMNRYGDTPLGMVESALEFARIAREQDFHNFVFSMKASNPKIMIEAYRLLAATLMQLGDDWNYPLHLGVTEAGDGEDGRIKSAIGIGSLLADGIGDTVRISLTEDPIYEVPVGKKLITATQSQQKTPLNNTTLTCPYHPFEFTRRETPSQTLSTTTIGSNHPIRVAVSDEDWYILQAQFQLIDPCLPEVKISDLNLLSIDPYCEDDIKLLQTTKEARVITIKPHSDYSLLYSYRRLAALAKSTPHAILLQDFPNDDSKADVELATLSTAFIFGSLLCDGIGDVICLHHHPSAPADKIRTAYTILQSAGCRAFKADYVACPSCGRTLFNLQHTTKKIRQATEHLKEVRIAIMGCIVNGPGEMADADFGYVGGAPGKINLYVGKKAVKFNIPEENAVTELINLIKEHNRWIEPK